MANYRSLVGGFFSSTPMDRSSGPVSIRTNNPGAVNSAKWIKEYPGYVADVETTPGNKSTIFESPEYGVAAWLELMYKYANADATTLEEIVTRYGGGQDYSGYVNTVAARSGLKRDTEIDLEDDIDLLAFAKAMFAYEAGRPTPLSDVQILYGFNLARLHREGKPLPTAVTVQRPPSLPSAPSGRTLWDLIGAVLEAIFPSLKQSAPTQHTPPILAPPKTPPWYTLAVTNLGFHEVGNNQGIEKYIAAAHTGELGAPWCAVLVNAMLESSGVKGSRSAAARSFEDSPDFVELDNPALGAIVTMWRNSPSSGLGHVFFADGVDASGNIRGIAGNEQDQVERTFHDKSRIVGYYWPKSYPMPTDVLPLVSKSASRTKET